MHRAFRGKRRFPSWVVPAFGFGLAVNVLLLLLLPMLSQVRTYDADMTEPVGVNLVRVREEEPPPEDDEPRKIEEKEDPEIREQLQPDLVRPSLQALDMPTVSFQADTRLVRGPGSAGLGMFFNADELDHPPRALFKPPPIYPYKATRLEIEGAVTVKFLVDERGVVSRVSVLEAKPKGLFEDAVLATLPTWKFSPGKILGEPVTSWVTTTIHFELH